MRNRIRNILVLMCTCILGIFAFQGYWLYNNYQLKLDEFNKDINDALRTALFNKQFMDAGRYLNLSPVHAAGAASNVSGRGANMSFHKFPGQFYFDATVRIDTPIMLTITRQTQTDTVHGTSSVAINAQPATLAVSNFTPRQMKDSVTRRVYVDSFAREVSQVLMMNKFYEERPSIKKLDSTFTAELLKHGITTDYKLDTMKIDPYATAPSFFEKPANKLQTARNSFNPFSSIFVQATFGSPLRDILGKMIWTLLSSALLLIFTTLCFLYMLRTILRQKKLSEVRNDFINNMTHELKTPIATVSAAVEAMQNFNALSDQQKTKQYLQISRQELNRLSDLVEKVLHIAVEEKEDIELFREPVDLNELVRHIVGNHRLKANKKVDFHYTLLAEPMVNVDKTHLSNAINNLVDNAIKYSGDPAEVSVFISRRGDLLQVTVKDNGIGIPHNYQDSIFEKFFRVPTGNLHNVKGFGLGLSYVKKIVEKHGGSISVKSEPEKGSAFLLEIPSV